MKLFVYGTLKEHYKHPLMRGLTLVGADTIRGYSLYDLGSFPGVVKTVGNSVIGEVYEVCSDDKDRLGALDSYEGYPYLYEKDTVITEKGHTCLLYVYNSELPTGAKHQEEWGITHNESSQ